MIFSSYIFVLAFLPIAVLGYWLIQRWRGLESAMVWLTLCSLFYYGWWNPIYLILICSLMLVNYGAGLLIYQRRFAPKLLMIAGAVVHYREVVAEFLRIRQGGLTARHVAVGLSIFAMGVFKKSVSADNV